MYVAYSISRDTGTCRRCMEHFKLRNKLIYGRDTELSQKTSTLTWT